VEVVVTYYIVLSQYLSGGTEEKHKSSLKVAPLPYRKSNP